MSSGYPFPLVPQFLNQEPAVEETKKEPAKATAAPAEKSETKKVETETPAPKQDAFKVATTPAPKEIAKTQNTIADEDGPLIKPTSQKDMEAGADVAPELDPNFGKSKGDIKKEAISKGTNSAPSPADKIGQKYKDTKPVKEEKKELPFCGPKLGSGVPCK